MIILMTHESTPISANLPVRAARDLDDAGGIARLRLSSRPGEFPRSAVVLDDPLHSAMPD